MPDPWPYPGLADTPQYRRLAADPHYARLFAGLYGGAQAAPPARAALPVLPDCFYLGDPLPGLSGCGGCLSRLRGCVIYGVCTVGPSPARHWCGNAEAQPVCPDYVPKDAPPE